MVKAHNADYIKTYNRKTILGILRHSTMSRAELARATGLTRATISLIVDELIGEGALAELAPKKAERGRRGLPLAIRPERYLTLGVNIAREGCSVGICDFGGNLLSSLPVGTKSDPLGDIIEALEALLLSADRDRVVGIGVVSPGPLDTQNGRILNPPQFDRWHGVSVSPVIEERLRIPAYLEHDARALALHQREISGIDDILLLLVAQIGVGSGMVCAGKMLGEQGYFTGELGHISIRYDGRRCVCGNRGCLETYASIGNLLAGSRFGTWRELIDALGSDDANTLLNREGEYLATGIINLINLIPVDTVYLAGEISYSGEPLRQRVQRIIRERSMNRSYSDIHVRIADSRPEAELLAACDVAFSRFLAV